MAGLPGTKRLIAEKQPVFLQRTDFDASSLGRRFDFVISHSVLSHAAHWQCPQFFKGVQRFSPIQVSQLLLFVSSTRTII